MEIYVKRDFFGHYSGIDSDLAKKLVNYDSYSSVTISCDDRTIVLVFRPILAGVVTEDYLRDEVRNYFEYVKQITGIEVPAIIE